jgi:probable FeS assembly SUF system protein SufT
MSHREIIVTRDVDAVQIPSGSTLRIPQGTKVIITQSLGGTHTVSFNMGLARIDAANQDALSMESVPVACPDNATHGEVTESDIWSQLKGVYDPEIPVNIVDLGLVYSMELTAKEEGGHRVLIKMTLTAPGCGMGPTIANDAKQRVLSLPGIVEAEVDLVWDPPWNQGMISEAGRMKLGMV